MEFIESEEVSQLLASYPKEVRKKLEELRSLIIEVANETSGVDKLLETMKWGEPSYLVKSGSTIRMDWKQKTPANYYLYFICSTRLIRTFEIMIGNELQFEGNRAIVLRMDEPIPKEALKRCVSLAMRYHQVKNLPLLGV